jgi:hypothetical protein
MNRETLEIDFDYRPLPNENVCQNNTTKINDSHIMRRNFLKAFSKSTEETLFGGRLRTVIGDKLCIFQWGTETNHQILRWTSPLEVVETDKP